MTVRFILVTGAASGIGRAVATRLAADGARLALVDRDGAALATCLAGHPQVLRIVGDVADPAFWDGQAGPLAGLDGAVINAGVAAAGPIETLEFAEWRRVMAVNLDGAFLTLQAALRAIGAHTRGGAIVATASVAGFKPEPGTAAYAASKAALIQLVRVAAKENAARSIRVNAIAPGGVDTPIWDTMPFFVQLVAQHGSRAAAIDAMAQQATPLGHYATADEIAGQIAFLLSDAARSVTGSVLTVDGGYSL